MLPVTAARAAGGAADARVGDRRGDRPRPRTTSCRRSSGCGRTRSPPCASICRDGSRAWSRDSDAVDSGTVRAGVRAARTTPTAIRRRPPRRRAVGEQRFLLRGSIDLVERRADGQALRVTDHKTGKNRTTHRHHRRRRPGAAAGALRGGAGGASPASRWTRAGCRTAPRPAASATHAIALDPIIRRRGLEVLEIVDRAIEHGTLAARPGADGRPQRLRVLRLPAGVRPRRGRAGSSASRRSPTSTRCGGSRDPAPGRRRRPPADRRGARRHAGRRGRRRHRQDHRAGQAHRPADRDRPGHDSRDRRRHLLREGRRRAEAAPARGTGAGAVGGGRRPVPRPRGSATPSSGSKSRTSAPSTASAPTCCASGRSRRASIRRSRCSPRASRIGSTTRPSPTGSSASSIDRARACAARCAASRRRTSARTTTRPGRSTG